MWSYSIRRIPWLTESPSDTTVEEINPSEKLEGGVIVVSCKSCCCLIQCPYLESEGSAFHPAGMLTINFPFTLSVFAVTISWILKTTISVYALAENSPLPVVVFQMVCTLPFCRINTFINYRSVYLKIRHHRYLLWRGQTKPDCFPVAGSITGSLTVKNPSSCIFFNQYGFE